MSNDFDHGTAGHGDHGSHAQAGGLSVSENGYTLELDTSIFGAGTRKIAFRVLGSDGQPLTEFTPSHDKDLHFIAVRRDTSGFQHVHPVMDTSGTWSVDLDLTPGDWRFFADFHPTGHTGMTLGIDASVGGEYQPQPLPEALRTATAGEYTVSLQGQLVPGKVSELTLSIGRNNQPVTDLQPYLAAYGHLVALRVGDLGYLHVHPEGGPEDNMTKPGPEILFVATAPSAGPYRLYLDFQHEGVVRTAEFTVHANGTARTTQESSQTTPGHGHHQESPA